MTIMTIKRYCKGLSKSNFRLRIKGIDFKNSHYVTNSIPGPLHIWMATEENQGYIQCEKLALLDMSVRGYKKVDSLPIAEMINVSDAIQGIFEYI